MRVDAAVRKDTLIEAKKVTAGYRGTVAVRDLDLAVRAGEMVALLGANGAGKSTTLLCLAGELPPMQGTVTWKGNSEYTPLYRRARNGLALVTEQRSVFMGLTTQQNLSLAGDVDIDKAFELFPPLAALKDRRAGLLSGGEQQMLTLARALSRPTELLLADELSLGLAPQTTEILLDAVRAAVDSGMGALVVEQHVSNALRVADRVIVLRHGQVAYRGTNEEAARDIDQIQSLYMSG